MVEKEKDIDVVEELRWRVEAFHAGTCTIYYKEDATLDRKAADEIERLRGILKSVLNNEPGAFAKVQSYFGLITFD